MAKYLSLSKARLGSLVVATTAGGYLLAPDPIVPVTFALTCVGTALAIASANSINQYLEADSDVLMRRTQSRPLPAGELSMGHALAFGVVTGALGTALLALTVNPLSAALALGNIVLYTLVYTPLKKRHWLNTWVGAIVGAIPPLIGWAANTGTLDPGAWLLAYALFIWQIPHFLALSWPLEADYRRAGYAMLINADRDKVRRLTLRYTLYLLPVAPLAVHMGLCAPAFALTGSLLAGWLVARTIPFYRTHASSDARKAFMATIYYLPLLIVLLLVHKALGYVLEKDEEDELLSKERVER